MTSSYVVDGQGCDDRRASQLRADASQYVRGRIRRARVMHVADTDGAAAAGAAVGNTCIKHGHTFGLMPRFLTIARPDLLPRVV